MSEYIIQFFTQTIRFKALSHSEMKQINIFMSEWVIQSFTQTICSKVLIHSGIKQQHYLLLILFWLRLDLFSLMEQTWTK